MSMNRNKERGKREDSKPLHEAKVSFPAKQRVPVEANASAEPMEISPREYWTVNGKPIAELPQSHMLAYQHTDQFFAMRAKQVEGRVASGISVSDNVRQKTYMRSGEGEDLTLRDREVPKHLAEWADLIQGRGYDANKPADPMKAIADKYTQNGFVPRFLHPDNVENSVTEGYRVVKKADGEPVRYGRMILGEMPKEVNEIIVKRTADANRLAYDRQNHEVNETHLENLRATGPVSDKSMAKATEGVQNDQPY